MYQTDQNLDDTIPYLDPLLELQRDSHIVINLPDHRPPSPFRDSLVRQRYTPPPLPYIAETQTVIRDTSGDTTQTAVESAGDVNLTEALQETEETEETTVPEDPVDEQNDNVDLIDLVSEASPIPYIVLDSREEEEEEDNTSR